MHFTLSVLPHGKFEAKKFCIWGLLICIDAQNELSESWGKFGDPDQKHSEDILAMHQMDNQNSRSHYQGEFCPFSANKIGVWL